MRGLSPLEQRRLYNGEPDLMLKCCLYNSQRYSETETVVSVFAASPVGRQGEPCMNLRHTMYDRMRSNLCVCPDVATLTLSAFMCAAELLSAHRSCEGS